MNENQTGSEFRSLFVPEGLDGVRVDLAVAKLLGLSRSFVAEIATQRGILVNGKIVSKSDYVNTGGLLEVTWCPKKPVEIVPIKLPELQVLYSDEDIIVVEKPVGVAAHPSVGWKGPDVLGALVGAGFTISTSGLPERTGIVQRLDVGTSGVMVVAKSERAYTVLKRAFRDRTIKKTYHTVVQGYLDPLKGTIDAPISRHQKSDWKFSVIPTGKPSVTHYTTLEVFRSASLLQVKLETGRTHQIRVHFAALNHPCVGDPLYGSNPRLTRMLGLERQWLHATRLEFEHPITGKLVSFESSYSADLRHALDVLRSS